MNPAVSKQRPILRAASRMASEQEWKRCTNDIQVNILAVDRARNCVEFLFKIAPGYRSDRHRHICEIHLFVVTGKVVNPVTGCTFGPGDYCHPSYGDGHVEQFPDGAILYGSYCGNSDRLVEFYDDDGEVCGHFKVSDFSAP